MAKTAPASAQLSLFDTTALTSPFSLFGGGNGGLLPALGGDDNEDDAPGTPIAPAIPRVVARDFRLAADRGLAAGWKARAADNLAAIRLLQRIEGETRPATAEEQTVLARFVGYGAGDLANTLFRRPGEAWREGWAEQGDGLEQAVSSAELASLSRCTQYAHFTPEYIVRAVWAGLARMGFQRGSILEPGCGTGQFLALRPEGIEDCSAVTGIEMDPITARIAALLYPKAWIRNEDFTRAKLAESFDLAVGNPPFSDRTVRAEDPAGKLGLKLHDYFIARAVERLKPGGLAAFVTSHGTMDKVDPKAREHIGGMADLVGAIRLPAGAFASSEEQASVWKSQKPKRNERANWHMVAHGLDKRRIPFTLAKFGEAETEAFGILWEDDLFAPGDADPRFTTQADAFLQAQQSWLEANLPEGGVLLGMAEYYRPQLPPRAQQVYSSRPGPSDTVGYYVNHRSFEVDTVLFRMPEPAQRRASTGSGTGEDDAAPKAVRPDLTQKGEAMVGDLRTEALHTALAEAEIPDHALIGLLVLALAGQNVSVRSGAHGNDIGSSERGSLTASITVGGVLTADPGTLRAAARGMLRQALSCRVGFSSSGMVARVAGIAVDADAYLPTTATEEFLGNLSKAAIERTATATSVLPRNTGKATRAAIVEHLKGRTFLHPLVRFDFTDEERCKAEAARAREVEMEALRRGGHAAEDDGAEDEDGMESPEHLLDADEEEGTSDGIMPPPGDVEAPAAHAA